MILGQGDNGVLHCREALAMAEHLSLTVVRADALATLGALLQQETTLREAIDFAEAANLPEIAHRAHQNYATFALRAIGPEVARDYFLRAAEWGRRMGSLSHEVFSRVSAAEILIDLG